MVAMTMTLPVPTPFQPDPSRSGPQASAFPISRSQQLDASVPGVGRVLLRPCVASPCLGDVSGSAEPPRPTPTAHRSSLYVSTALQQDACVFACSVSLFWD
ncbi:unnamed protein product [Boreogadus saida]